MFVMKMVGLLYLLILIFDLIVVCSMGSMSGATTFFLVVFLLAIIAVLLVISRKPQNRWASRSQRAVLSPVSLNVLSALLAAARLRMNYISFRKTLLFMTPGLPFVPAIAVMVNIYLIFKLSILTLVRFTVWMAIGTLRIVPRAASSLTKCCPP
jgi:cationic amino acid transporter 14